MIKRILCPTDLTAKSRDGAIYAFSLAQRNGAQLIVFHARPFPTVWQVPCALEADHDRWQQILAKFKIDRLLSQGVRQVKRFVCETLRRESYRVIWKPTVAVGGVADEIVTAALQEEVDLIVVDRRRRSLLARVFRHGILERVSRKAPCPVLVMDATKSTDRSGGWRMPVLEELSSY
jgi:nucleotide-binding universal stress UspA family protein